MSFDRRQDLDYQPSRSRSEAQVEAGEQEQAEGHSSERALEDAVRRLRGNDAALIGFLQTKVPPWQRRTARIVLIRTLGASRASSLCERGFGLARVLFPGEPPAHAAHADGPAPGSPAALFRDLGPGEPLGAATAARMGEAFQHDFSDVRVHTGSAAAQAAAQQDATAFTVGRDVVFAAGRYRPATPEGDALLAHELAHVVQQGGGAVPAGTWRRPLSRGSGDHEADADLAVGGVLAQLYAGVKSAGRRLKPAMTTGLSLQRCTPSSAPTITDPFVLSLKARLDASPRDLAGFYGALSGLNPSRAGDAAVRGGLQVFLDGGKLSSAEAFRAVALQELGPDRGWPAPVRNFAEGLDSGTFSIAGLAPAGADNLREFCIVQAGMAAEGAANPLAAYRYTFDSRWDSAAYSALPADFDNTLDSKGPRNQRARRIFNDLYAAAPVKAAYDTDTPAGFRALCDKHEAPDGINNIASQRLQRLRALLDPPPVVATGTADPPYAALVTAVTPVAQALDARDHQEIDRSHTWRLAVEAKVNGATPAATQALRDDLWSVITTARPSVAPGPAPGPPPAPEPVPAVNPAQHTWLGGIHITAPASPQNAHTAEHPLSFQVRSAAANPGLAVRRRVVVEPAAQVTDGQQDEQQWPSGSSAVDHTARVNPDAGVAGSAVFTAKLTMPPLPTATFAEQTATVTVADKRLDWFKATINPGVTCMDENNYVWLGPGTTHHYFGGQFPITVRPQLGAPPGGTTANPNLTIFMDGAIKRGGAVMVAMPRVQFGALSEASPLFNTILQQPVPPPPAAGDAMEVVVNYYAGPAAAPPIQTQSLPFTLAASIPVAAGADAALVAADNTQINLPAATAGSLLNYMTTATPAGSPSRAVAAAVGSGAIRIAACIVRSDSAAKVTVGGRNPATEVAYAMGTVDPVGDFTHTLIASAGAIGWRWPAIPGTVFLNLTPNTHAPATKRGNAQMSELLTHEGIHAADRIAPNPFGQYATEFRAYWIMGTGAGLSTAPDPTMSNLGPKSARANAIFRHLYGSATYPFVQPNYDANVNHFREQVDNMLHPDGINLTLSGTLASLRTEIESYASSAANYPPKRAAVVAKYALCTPDDRREITGNREWRDLVEDKFGTAVIAAPGPPPVNERDDIKNVLAIPR